MGLSGVLKSNFGFLAYSLKKVSRSLTIVFHPIVLYAVQLSGQFLVLAPDWCHCLIHTVVTEDWVPETTSHSSGDMFAALASGALAGGRESNLRVKPEVEILEDDPR